MTPDELQAEVERLRTELENYRRREIEDLRTQLAEAKYAAEHYRKEAERNAALGQQIATEHHIQVADLRGQLDTARMAGYGQRGRPISGGS